MTRHRLILAAALAAALAACGPADRAAVEKYCADNQIDCATVARQWVAAETRQAGGAAGLVVVAAEVAWDQAPADLQEWARTQQMAEAPAYRVVSAGGEMWLAATGGLQPTGGYRLEATVRREGDGWLADVRVIPPPPDVMVTQALTNPVGFFRLPGTSGPVQVSILAPAAPPSLPPKADR